MTIRNLWVQQFRNYADTSLTFSPTTTILVGKNASGKTNLLEAIATLSTGKSFRAESDREMIAFDAQLARMKAQVVTAGDVHTLELVLTQGIVQGSAAPLKKYLVNGVSKRMVDFVGMLRCVRFWPQDLELVTDTPSCRRRYLDQVLVQVDRDYRRALSTYEQALRRRNKVLEAIREGMAHRKQLTFWDEALIEHGTRITAFRKGLVAALNAHPSGALHPDAGVFRLVYDASVMSQPRLEQYADAEIAAATTLVGPQRDDLIFLFQKQGKELELARFGSRGEQRLGVLWLKMGESAFLDERSGEKSVLLLDDMFSELDEQHRSVIIQMAQDHQTIITTTDAAFIDASLCAQSTVFHLPLP